MPEKRVVRSKDERKAELQKKIEYHKACIRNLEAKVKAIDNPRTPVRSKGVRRILAEAKLTDEEAAQALGFQSAEKMKEKLLAAAEKKAK